MPGRSILRLWLSCFAAAAVLYLASAQRGASWQDSGMFQWRAWTGDAWGNLGLALAHPLYVAGGRLAVVLAGGNFAFALNFFSGLGMAVALANLAVVAAVLTGRRWIGLATAAMLAVAHTAWWLATIAEVYTWSVAGLSAELWLLVLLLRRPRWHVLTGLALVSGLGLCVHNFALLPLPVYIVVAAALVVRRKLPAWSLAAAAGAYLVGAGLYIGMTIDLAARTGDTAGAIGSALFGEKSRFAGAVLGTVGDWRFVKFNAGLMAFNFLSFLFPLAVVGWANLRRRLGAPPAAALAAITAIEAIFVLRYPVPDQFTFFLPTLVMVGLASAIGIGVLADKSRRWRVAAVAACAISIVAPPAVYATVPAMARALGVNIRRELPRDEIRYWAVPWKQNEDSAERFAAAALRQARPDGVILPDSTSEYVLKIAQRRDGLASGVTVQFQGAPLPRYGQDPREFRRLLAGRPLFVVSPAIAAALSDDADFVRPPSGVLWRVVWKDGR